MTKQLTSAEAAAIVYGSPGTKVMDRDEEPVFVDRLGLLCRNESPCAGALSSNYAPFTLPADPDKVPEDVEDLLDVNDYRCAIRALWKHIKPEAKRKTAKVKK